MKLRYRIRQKLRVWAKRFRRNPDHSDGSMHSDCPTYYDGCHCDEAAQSDGTEGGVR